jgi:hypothetical protein
MSHDTFAVDQGSLRGTDSNSLLRMYDLAKASAGSASRQERDRAGRALRRITKELRKRNVPFATGDDRDVRPAGPGPNLV